ncbi:MAG: DUF983 domain-containing protein [Planctomycetota bacterium]|jgi:uncharacterized protein (DUF983 family)
MSRSSAILRLRCPRCKEGAVFGGLFRMHPGCTSCGLTFEREPGYFLGAMYFSYGMALVAGFPLVLVLWLQEVPLSLITVALVIELVLLASPLFRYSRVLWLHFDHGFDPR